MKKCIASKLLLLLLISYCNFTACDARSRDYVDATGVQLNLSKTEGYAPLYVSIKGPSPITALAQSWDGTWRQWSGAGFAIDWGDGVIEPTSEMRGHPRSLTSHTYTVPGVYVVKVRIYHPGPDDGAVNDWAGSSTVKVADASSYSTPKIDLAVLSPKGGETCLFQDYPRIKWRLSTNRSVTMLVEVVDQSGAVVDTNIFRI